MHKLYLLFSILALTAIGNVDLSAQTARTTVQTILTRMVPNNQLPNDLTLTGQVTDSSGVAQPFRITIKGKDQARYEVGTGAQLVTTVHAKGGGWTEASGKRTFLQPYSSIRRPGIVPFLDLLNEANTPALQITDQGNFALGNLQTRRFTLKLPDPTPNARLFRKAIDEEIDLYVDPQSLLVVRSESWIVAENNPVARVRSIQEYADYRSVAGLAIPFQIRNTTQTPGQRSPQWVFVITGAIVNSGVEDSTFTFQEAAR